MIRGPPRATRTDTPLPYTRFAVLARLADHERGDHRGGAVVHEFGHLRLLARPGRACREGRGARLSRHARSSRRAHPRDPDRLAFRVDGGDGIGAAGRAAVRDARQRDRSEEHTSELPSLMRISYAVFCLKRKKHTTLTL